MNSITLYSGLLLIISTGRTWIYAVYIFSFNCFYNETWIRIAKYDFPIWSRKLTFFISWRYDLMFAILKTTHLLSDRPKLRFSISPNRLERHPAHRPVRHLRRRRRHRPGRRRVRRRHVQEGRQAPGGPGEAQAVRQGGDRLREGEAEPPAPRPVDQPWPAGAQVDGQSTLFKISNALHFLNSGWANLPYEEWNIGSSVDSRRALAWLLAQCLV